MLMQFVVLPRRIALGRDAREMDVNLPVCIVDGAATLENWRRLGLLRRDRRVSPRARAARSASPRPRRRFQFNYAVALCRRLSVREIFLYATEEGAASWMARPPRLRPREPGRRGPVAGARLRARRRAPVVVAPGLFVVRTRGATVDSKPSRVPTRAATAQAPATQAATKITILEVGFANMPETDKGANKFTLVQRLRVLASGGRTGWSAPASASVPRATGRALAQDVVLRRPLPDAAAARVHAQHRQEAARARVPGRRRLERTPVAGARGSSGP